MKPLSQTGHSSRPTSKLVRPLTSFDDWRSLEPQLEAIFFEASGRTFAPGPERDAFRERWLGRYLERWPEWAFVLVAEPASGPACPATIAGYLIGCLDNPASSPLFADLPYFQDFAAICARFPAHLHINLDPTIRGQGHGGRLIEAFACAARAAGAPGMHVVTAPTARNVSFYARLGFVEAARTAWNGKPVALLGRLLA